MRSKFSRLAERFRHPAEAGQSLVILALGFIGLLGFVGIVTDVSLMFINYSTLTRAVDSASVAAAGQVRRLVPTDDEYFLTCGTTNPAFFDDECVRLANNRAFARSFANVGVAARQFLEFYGVNPRAVVVDMCSTVSMYDEDEDILVPIEGLEKDYDELCADKNNQRKLIRVTAQSISPTVFLRLLGWPDILLQASAISETAVLDVVLILDVSESMLTETTYETWARQGYDKIYMPPAVTSAMAAPAYLNVETGYGPGADGPMVWYQLSYLGQDVANSFLTNNPANLFYVREMDYPYPIIYDGPARDTVRAECQVRFWPYSVGFDVPGFPVSGQPIPPAGGSNVFQMYRDADPSGQGWVHGRKWQGYVPTYDYYGCCNDPNGDGNFDDLLCQPFREMRDATEAFLQRIDFLRGDRVAFVTFDREAYLMNYQNAAGDYTHMIESEIDALRLLRENVGVKAEPSYYEPQVVTIDGNPVQYVPWRRDPTTGTAMASTQLIANDYPVNNNCPFQDAILSFPYHWRANPWQQFIDLNLLPARPEANPDLLRSIMYPRGGSWETLKNNVLGNSSSFYSYDLWASCRGTNVGAALREGSNALLDQRTRRTDGAVWVMVLLGDGAAAASDPVRNAGQPTVPQRRDYPYAGGFQVQYGGLGLCPPGTTNGNQVLSGELVNIGSPRNAGSPSFPFCSDIDPASRHFCFDPTLIDESGNQYFVDVGNVRVPAFARDCATRYDVDDYARDWADWIGLAEPPNALRREGGAQQRGITQLPTIFTIGFGLNFAEGTQRCRAGEIAIRPGNPRVSDIGDCLGEELLRYIADVGDNFRIDTYHQQSWLDNYQADLSLGVNEWGDPGPCENPNINPAAAGSFLDLIDPLPAGESCGNYYNAPTGDELGDVFDDIASRMFTRLTQ